jgi:hypothetical protein
MDLKEHIRAVASFGLDPFTERALDRSVKDVRAVISKAKKGDTAELAQDILDIALIFHALVVAEKIDGGKAYLALRRYADFVLGECPHMRVQLTELLAPFFNLNITLN